MFVGRKSKWRQWSVVDANINVSLNEFVDAEIYGTRIWMLSKIICWHENEC